MLLAVATPQMPMLMKRPQPHRVRAHRRVQTTITVSKAKSIIFLIFLCMFHLTTISNSSVQQQSVMANQKPSNRNTKVSIYTSLHLTTTTTYQYFTRIEKIRVGRDYQAVCPQLVPELDRRPELMNERALLVWSPTKEIPDMKCKCAY